jgi:hypothetical protein
MQEDHKKKPVAALPPAVRNKGGRPRRPPPKVKPKKQKRKRPKERFPWEKWRAAFVASDPEKVPALIDFFEPLGVKSNTWQRHTGSWRRERMAYREQLAAEALRKFRKGAVDVLTQQFKMGQIVSTLAFNDLVVKDPATRETYLAHKVRYKDPATGLMTTRLEPLKASDVIRLFSEGQRGIGRAFNLDSSVHGIEPLPGYTAIDVTPPPPPPGEQANASTPALPPSDGDRDLADLRSILKDTDALRHAAALLNAIEKGRKGADK